MIISMKHKTNGNIETKEKVSMIKHERTNGGELTILQEDGKINTYDLNLWSMHKVLESFNIKDIEIGYVGQVLFTECPMCGKNIAQSMTHKNITLCEHCGIDLDLKTEYLSRKF